MVNNQTVYHLYHRHREKRGDILFGNAVTHPFTQAAQQVGQQQLRSEALGDVRNMGLASLGIGAGGAGILGLVKALKKNVSHQLPISPNLMPIPLPVHDDDAPKKRKRAADVLGCALQYAKSNLKTGFDKHADVTTKGGLPWYAPAMLGTGLGGLALGYKGVSSLLKNRAKKEREQELDAARDEFHTALMSQYDKPLAADTGGRVVPQTLPKLASAPGELSAELDRLFDNTQQAVAVLEKRGTLSDVAGGSLGAYGVYAGLTGLLTGSLVYDKAKKRSRQAILEKALKKRDRRAFAMQPNEIHAAPEFVPTAAPGALAPASALGAPGVPGLGGVS